MKISNILVNPRNHLYRSTNTVITEGNIYQLHKALEENCVEKKDIQELIAIVKSEKPDFENWQLAEKANDWILKVFGKIVNCEGRINRTLTANSLATIVKRYYGISY